MFEYLFSLVDLLTISSEVQQSILDRLDDFLLGEKQTSRKSSLTLVAEPDMTIRQASGSELWQALIPELQRYGISEAQASQYRETILERAAASAAAREQGSPVSSLERGYPQHLSEDAEVLSATYGPGVVTDTVQRLFRAHITQKLSKISFTVTNETLGDTRPGVGKVFCLVWRKLYHLDLGGTLYSAPQRISSRERNTVVIDLSNPLPHHESSGDKPGSIHIVAASWHDMDVTKKVAAIAKTDQEPSISASNYEFDKDPADGATKTLSVTWAYSDIAAALSYCEVTTRDEGQTLTIPPFLDVKMANWGGLDITNTVRARIGLYQNLSLDTNNIYDIAPSDPWPQTKKSILILYQYGTYPMQIIVVPEGSGLLTISPSNPFSRKFFFRSNNGPGPDISILAVVCEHSIFEVIGS